MHSAEIPVSASCACQKAAAGVFGLEWGHRRALRDLGSIQNKGQRGPPRCMLSADADADAESGQAYTNSGMGQQPWTLLRSYGSTLQPSVQSLVSPCSVADEPQTKSAVSTPDMACPHGNTWSRVRTRGLHRTAERGARTASQRLRSHPWPAAWPAAWQAEGQTAGKQPASLPCLASHPAIRSSKPGAVAAAARDRVPSG